MKKYLSLILVFAFMLSMIPMSVSADVTDAELKSVTVTGATLIPSLTSGTYTYDVIVDDKEALLPQLNYTLNDNTASYEVLKSADYLGDYTLVKVTDGQTENTYKFTFREPYEVSTQSEFAITPSDATTVRTDRKHVAWTTTTNHMDVKRVKDTEELTYIPLILFDLTGKNVNYFGNFELSLVIANKYSNNVNMEIKAVNIPNTWTNEEATYNNTLLNVSDPYDESVNATFYTGDYENFQTVKVDITGVVRNQLSKGNLKFTLTINITDNVDAQVNFYRKPAADRYLPVLTYYPIKKSSDASLKSLDITGGIIDKVFDSDVYEYNIGVKENETPSIEYILNNSHANAVYEPANAIGETAVIKVTAQDGLTQKEYKLKLVSYEDFGISETGETTVSNTYFTNSQGKITSLTAKENIKFNVSYTNFNINNKKLTLVTVQKRNGILINNGINIETIEVPTGMDTISTSEIKMPNNATGLTIEGYVYEYTDKIALFDKVSVPAESAYTPTVTNTEEIIGIKTDGVNVIIYGKSKPESLIPVIATHPNKELSSFKKTDTSAIAVYDIAKSDSNGIWEKTVRFPNTAGWYKVYIGGVSEGKSFLHASTSQKMAVVQVTYDKIFDHENTDEAKTQALKDIKTHLGLCDINNTNDEIISLDNSVYNILNEEDVIVILYNIVKETYQTKPTISSVEDITPFVKLYDKAVKLAKINAGIEISVSDLILEFSFSDLTSLFNTVVSTRVDALDLSVLNKNVTGINSLYNLIKTNILFEIINYPESVGIAQNHIETYGSYLDFDFSTYTYISNKEAVVQTFVNEGPYSTLSQMTEKFSSLVSSLGIIGVIGGGSAGGGSNGGGGGGGSFSPSVTGGKTDTPKYTDEVVPKDAKIFNDVESDHWSYEPTKYLSEKGILKGMDNGNFEPDRSIKREEFAKILVLAFNLQAKDEDKLFTDVKDTEWYYEYVKIAAQNGIINGIGDGVFGVSVELSRQDIAVMIARVLNKNEASEEIFNDDSEISSYAKDAVYTLKNLGVLNGTGNGNFEPKRPVTRAECAKIVYELIKE